MKIFKFNYALLGDCLCSKYWDELDAELNMSLNRFKDFRRHTRLYTAIFKTHQIYSYFLYKNVFVWMFKGNKICKKYRRIKNRVDNLLVTVDLTGITNGI